MEKTGQPLLNFNSIAKHIPMDTLLLLKMAHSCISSVIAQVVWVEQIFMYRNGLEKPGVNPLTLDLVLIQKAMKCSPSSLQTELFSSPQTDMPDWVVWTFLFHSLEMVTGKNRRT